MSAAQKTANAPGPLRLDDLPIAIMWLESNEGEGEELIACQRAAAFLKAEQVRREEMQIKRLARRHGTSVENVRAAIGKAAKS